MTDSYKKLCAERCPDGCGSDILARQVKIPVPESPSGFEHSGCGTLFRDGREILRYNCTAPSKAQYILELEQKLARFNVCTTCGGMLHASGLVCICGGSGAHEDEVRNLRLCYLSFEQLVKELEQYIQQINIEGAESIASVGKVVMDKDERITVLDRELHYCKHELDQSDIRIKELEQEIVELQDQLKT